LQGAVLPKPFDEIVGYVSRGRGIKIHRVDCPNLMKIIENGGKVVEAYWSKRKEKNLYAFFRLIVQDVPGSSTGSPRSCKA